MADDGSVIIKIDGDDSGFRETAEDTGKRLTTLAQTLEQKGTHAGAALRQSLSSVPAEISRTGSAFAGLPATVERCVAAMEADIHRGVSSMRSQMTSAGANLSSGLWAGVEGTSGWLIGRLHGWCNTIISSVKASLGIHSPSTVMREQVGRMLALGMALGIEDEADAVRGSIALLSEAAIESAKDDASGYKEIGEKYIDNLTYGVEAGRDRSIQAMEDWVDADVTAYEKRVDEKTDTIVKALEKQEDKASDTRKAALEKQIDAVKDAADKQKTAYKNAADEVTSTYKTALTDGFDQALDTVKERVTAITEEAQDQYDAIQDSISKMEDKLTTTDLFSADDNGNVTLTNWEQQTRAVEAYGDALEQLKERGASDDFMAEVTSLDTDKAMQLMQKLASLSDEKFQQYIDGWQKQRDEAKQVAEQFYSDQLTALQSSFTDKLADALKTVPQTMTNIGTDSIQGLIDGMYSQNGALSAAAKSIINQAIAAMKQAADIHSPSKKTRDEVGKNLAAGIGVGFEAQMADVYRRIRSTLDTEIAGMSTVTAAQADRQAAQSNASYAAVSAAGGTTVENKTTVEFQGDLAALGRALHPVIRNEERRRGTNFVKGAD